MQLEVPSDIRENIAYFKKWKDTTKAQATKPFVEYPKMPLVPARDKAGKLTGKAPVPIFDTFKQPIVFATARDEAEWLADHPDEAEEIAQVEAGRAPATDKLEASNQALQAVTDRLKGAKAEIEAKDTALAEALAQLETAKLQLAAKKRGGLSPEEAAATSRLLDVVEADRKLDMRTKAGREAAAAQKAAVEG